MPAVGRSHHNHRQWLVSLIDTKWHSIPVSQYEMYTAAENRQTGNYHHRACGAKGNTYTQLKGSVVTVTLSLSFGADVYKRTDMGVIDSKRYAGTTSCTLSREAMVRFTQSQHHSHTNCLFSQQALYSFCKNTYRVLWVLTHKKEKISQAVSNLYWNVPYTHQF